MGQQSDRSKPRSEILVEVTRGSMVESAHRGFIVVVDAEGAIIARAGGVDSFAYFRSAAKPFQTIPIITSGAADHFNLTQRELAVITGSHSGESIHLETVKSILAKIGLKEDALLCGSHYPFDEATTKQLRAEGRIPGALFNNCSGKHAGMLAFARFLNEPIESYLDPEHAIQQRIRKTLARFAAVAADEITVAIDGCSAPVFGMSIQSMAGSYARLVQSRPTQIDPELGEAAERVVSSMIEYPEMIGGTHHRLDTDLMLTTKGGIVSKVGAEGVQLLGVLPCQRYPGGLGIAIKIEDGDIKRARDPVIIETLRQLGLLVEDQLKALSRYAGSNVYNHRQIEVGAVRPVFQLDLGT